MPDLSSMRHSLDPLRTLLLVSLLIPGLVGACTNISAEVVGTSADRIWIKKPLISEGGAADMAAEHCAESGRTAAFESEMSIADGKRIDIYRCQ